jgi:hypothetical protein
MASGANAAWHKENSSMGITRTAFAIAPEPFDMFARASRWPSRRHPRRDEDGHGGTGEGGTNANDTTDDGQNDTDDTDAKKADETKETDWKAESRKHEREAKANRAAAAELEKLKKSQMTDSEKRDADLKAANERADAAEARAAVNEAARKHNITDDGDLAFLSKFPADEVEALAKRLAKPATAGKSGTEVRGGKTSTDEMDPKKLAARAASRKPGIKIY